MVISKEECQQINWEYFGTRDGAKGISSLGEIVKACVKSDYTVSSKSQDDFLKSYDISFNKNYCIKQNAYNKGLVLVSSVFHQCKKNRDELFSAYTLGKTRGTLKKQISDLEQELRMNVFHSDEIRRRKKQSAAQIENGQAELDSIRKSTSLLQRELRSLKLELSKLPMFRI